MEFGNKLYEMRKKKGLSQEELAHKLNVTRQTISKWELSESIPDMEKLIMISDLFDISLDELVLGKKSESSEANKATASVNVQAIGKKVLTPENKLKMKKWLNRIGILLFVILIIDLISMILYFVIKGTPI